MLFKRYCTFVEERLHLSNRSKLHCIQFALSLHLKGVFFLRVQIDCIMAFYFCIQIVTVRPLGLENVCFPISFRRVLMK